VTKKRFAVKSELRNGFLMFEASVCLHLQGDTLAQNIIAAENQRVRMPGFPKLDSYGDFGQSKFMVMDLMGPSL